MFRKKTKTITRGAGTWDESSGLLLDWETVEPAVKPEPEKTKKPKNYPAPVAHGDIVPEPVVNTPKPKSTPTPKKKKAPEPRTYTGVINEGIGNVSIFACPPGGERTVSEINRLGGEAVYVKGQPFIKLKGTQDVTLWMSDLVSLKNKGAGDISVHDVIPASQEVILACSGIGSIQYHGRPEKLTAEVKGSGDIKLYGSTKHASLKATGIGNIKAKKFFALSAVCEGSGMGDIEVNAYRIISQRMSGMGQVKNHYEFTPIVGDANDGLRFTKQGVLEINRDILDKNSALPASTEFQDYIILLSPEDGQNFREYTLYRGNTPVKTIRSITRHGIKSALSDIVSAIGQ